MRKAKTDPRKAAADYRDHLLAELARIDDFLDMADRLVEETGEAEYGPGPLMADTASAAIH